MANWQLNNLVKKQQLRTLCIAGAGVFLLIAILAIMMANGSPKKTHNTQDTVDLTGIVDEPFTQAVSDNALTTQQLELESLKKQMSELTANIKLMNETHTKELETQKEDLKLQLQEVNNLKLTAENTPAQAEQSLPTELNNASQQEFWRTNNAYAMNENQLPGRQIASDVRKVHMVSFRPKRKQHLKPKSSVDYLNPTHYVPSNTSVRAVILGGADADASVNGQSKNNGVMLFKFLEDGTLPNGQRSRLRGCRVSANSYGDISSERAFATLYHLSCAHPGEPIIDKEVTGWIFFNGKVGIKGKPLMRDGKVMTWAGASNLISSASGVAQMSQSFSQLTPLGAASYVSPSNAIPYVGFGATARTGDYLAQYYVKRAEQYHPVIQVGSGNVVTVVFKDGFYLEPEADKEQHAIDKTKPPKSNHFNHDEENPNEMNFIVPPEVMSKINTQNGLSQSNQEVLR